MNSRNGNQDNQPKKFRNEKTSDYEWGANWWKEEKGNGLKKIEKDDGGCKPKQYWSIPYSPNTGQVWPTAG